jgi:hypothetical protein
VFGYFVVLFCVWLWVFAISLLFWVCFLVCFGCAGCLSLVLVVDLGLFVHKQHIRHVKEVKAGCECMLTVCFVFTPFALCRLYPPRFSARLVLGCFFVSALGLSFFHGFKRHKKA